MSDKLTAEGLEENPYSVDEAMVEAMEKVAKEIRTAAILFEAGRLANASSGRSSNSINDFDIITAVRTYQDVQEAIDG